MNDADFRLSPHIRPRHYAIHLAPDLQDWTFSGRVEIQLELEQQTSALELHALELEIDSASLSSGGREFPLKTQLHPARESVACAADQPLPPGQASLRMEFHGKIRSELRGLYRAQVGEERYAFTQCEATEARRIFPCFDEPSYKAQFTLSVLAPRDLTVISNEPVAGERQGDAPGTRLVQFETTPRMSSYLFALAVGKMDPGPLTYTSFGTPVRVWTVPGKVALSGFAREAAVASLERLEEYFGIKYPYRKLDLLAVPDFEAGAMENSGAVFFRERRLLCDPENTPLETLKSIAIVIAHELAHQWFGNLVTMQWWDDLWLNEAFASWMEYVIIDQWKPEWNVWIDFQQGKAAPFYTDALLSTRSIYAPVANSAQASEMFDAITYEKGAAVLRMIEQYLSADTYREGVRRYIRDHLEANATHADLFNALAAASSQPIRQVAADWIEQPGYPLLEARLAEGAERSALELSQRRFLLASGQAERVRDQRWRVPVVLRYQVDGGVHEQRVLLEEDSRGVDLEHSGRVEWLTANAGENGFYRVLYDDALAGKLLAHLDQALGPAERVGFLGNQWALTRAGRVSPGAFLDLLQALRGETARAVVETIVDRLAFLHQFLVDPADQPTFSALVERLFRPDFQQLGWSPAPGEDDDTRLRRAAVVRALGRVARSEDVVVQARELLEQHWQKEGSVDPNLLDTLVAIAAQSGDDVLYRAYLERSQRGGTPDEQFRHLVGLAVFEDPALIARTLVLLTTPTIQTQDVGLVLSRLLNNTKANQAAWDFTKAHWGELEPRLPPFMVRRVLQALVSLGTAEARQDVEAFFKAHPVPATERTLRQSLEEMDLLVAFRERARPELREYLARMT